MKYQLTICLLLMSAMGIAQQVNTQVGRVSTSFDYKDSEGNRLENLYADNGFSYAVGYRHPIVDRVYLNADIVYNIYKTYGSDEFYGNSFSWRTEYLGLSAGLEGEVYKKKDFTLLLRADATPHYMMKGDQLINEQAYDLKGVEQFDSPYLFYRGGVGVNFCAESTLAISMKYMYGLSMPLGKGDDTESLVMRTSTISIGLLWNFKKCKYCANYR